MRPSEIISFAVLCLAFATLITAVLVYVIPRYRLRKQIERRLFADAVHLNGDGYYSLYFANSTVPKPVVIKVVEILYDETGIDFFSLSADEDITGDLGKLLDGMDLVEVVYRLEEEFEIHMSDDEAVKLKTPRQIAEFSWSKQLQTSNQQRSS